MDWSSLLFLLLPLTKLLSMICFWSLPKEFEESREKRLELRGGVDPDDHTGEAFEEETVEFLVKEESTIMQE